MSLAKKITNNLPYRCYKGYSVHPLNHQRPPIRSHLILIYWHTAAELFQVLFFNCCNIYISGHNYVYCTKQIALRMTNSKMATWELRKLLAY